MMIRKIDCKNLLTLGDVIKSFKLNFRTKINKELPLLEKFVNKVAQLCKDKSNVPTPKLLERLETIQKFGFNAIEIIEYPEVLKMEKEELDLKMKHLFESCQNKAKVLVMVKHLKLPVTLRNSVAFDRHWDKSTVDGISAVERLRQVLRCSEEQMIDILTRNPRLRTIRNNLDIFEKIEVLFQYGAKPKDLWMNTNMLNSQTLEVVKVRAKKLHDLGCNDPLPIGPINRPERDYEKIIKKLEENVSSKEDVVTTIDLLKQIPYVKPNTIHVHKGKLDYLLSRGYSTDEILDNPNVFCDGLATIRNSVETMNGHYLEKVPLSRCVRNTNGKPDPPKNQRHSYKSLNVLNLTPQLRQKLIAYTKGTPPGIFRKFFLTNVSFLKDKGFSTEELSRLPIILCHEACVLEEWWERLWSDEKFRKEFEDDKLCALNRLQYSVEKYNNFRHVFSSAENLEPTEVEVFQVDAEEEDDEDIEKYAFDYDQIYASMSQ